MFIASPPPKAFPLELCKGAWVKKTRMMENIRPKISSHLDMSVTDGGVRTDEQTPV